MAEEQRVVLANGTYGGPLNYEISNKMHTDSMEEEDKDGQGKNRDQLETTGFLT
jgi:hypothetical protein